MDLDDQLNQNSMAGPQSLKHSVPDASDSTDRPSALSQDASSELQDLTSDSHNNAVRSDEHGENLVSSDRSTQRLNVMKHGESVPLVNEQISGGEVSQDLGESEISTPDHERPLPSHTPGEQQGESTVTLPSTKADEGLPQQMDTNFFLKDLLEITLRSLTSFQETTEKGFQGIMVLLEKNNSLLQLVVDQLSLQEKKTYQQVGFNQLESYVSNKLSPLVPDIAIYRAEKESPDLLGTSKASLDKNEEIVVKKRDDFEEHDEITSYTNLPRPLPVSPTPSSTTDVRPGPPESPPSSVQTDCAVEEPTPNETKNRRPAVTAYARDKGNRTATGRLHLHQNKQYSPHDGKNGTTERDTDNITLFRELEAEAHDMKSTKSLNKFSTGQNVSPDYSGQLKDIQPKTPKQSSSHLQPDEVEVQSVISNRGSVPNVSNSSRSSHRGAVSAMVLRLGAGSPAEAARLQDAVDRAHAPEIDPSPKARTFSTVLCLDISKSMWEGGAFQQMKDIAHEFLDGIEDAISDSGTEENIALVTFGGRASVAQHLTNDLSRIRDAIDRIEVGGKSPFYEALVVSLCALDGRGGTVSVSGEYDVKPRIIFVTDGKITEASDDPVAQDRVEDANNTRANFARLMMDLTSEENRGLPHPVIFVPVGSRADRKFLESMATLNKSPLVEPESIRNLCNYFQVQGTIGKVIVTLHNRQDENTTEHIQAVAQAFVPELNDTAIEEIVKTVQHELDQPDRKRHKHVKPTAFDDVFEDKEGVSSGTRLPLGTRVVRGPDWEWGNQDRNGPGTVIQHDIPKRPIVWVYWDHGDYNRYTYDPDMGYQIWKVDDAPRLQGSDGELQIGMQVKKGPGWGCQDPKYGQGKGAVIRKSKDGKQVKVHWENGEIQTCSLDEVEYCDPFDEEPKTLSEVLFGQRLDLVDDYEDQMEDGIPVWHWRDDWGFWRLYSETAIEALEKAYSRKKDGTCIVQRDGLDFRVLFRKKVEKAMKTGIERDVKREIIPPEELKSLKKAEELHDIPS